MSDILISLGHAVSDAYGVGESGNYTPSACLPKNAGGIVVAMGTFVNQVYVPLKISVCTQRTSITTKLMVPGTTGY